jgi:hypothetical protein
MNSLSFSLVAKCVKIPWQAILGFFFARPNAFRKDVFELKPILFKPVLILKCIFKFFAVNVLLMF